ncbi:actin depolymerization factor/cofilin-like domain-containing protein [Kitasatospora sp. NPDC002040]|uniref:actin-binding ADF family protein n=1 Tax=Kitasatospora sp. NPDC002040 TaxID=3154661 RepID=UPI00332A9BE8
MADGAGVKIADEGGTTFKELKAKKSNYVLYRLNETFDEVIVDKAGTAQTYDDFVDLLPRDEPRFVVHDLALTAGDGAKRTKVVLISWCPEGTGTKVRMVQSSAYNQIRGHLDGVAVYVQATDLSDLEYDEMVARAS